ncbi:DUF302 domain-containing protein [Brevibacillus borstelensis]|uniref:DUF302 domain-containing protein n=1 Tax=Brevibacillus borstelensis TaxID=45462 RepID=UPI00046AA173|nr:DUF302 domain-containing protein [Brevibacillus borstelensis]MCC0567106.1 DUF302 domain-containing protein [Brevibacillus borstelensis]MCM3473446.1 DUF302 domain-containing protein [Brevibacillus borstelensis]MCM3561466.1 DUF302 domain-containing protein [Brevibacillus borstelensis]MCM3593603.1 DUF302 domain-containing protein [Brevibacillus borstelensis]MED1850044.1 DUF302 domain-containing protein [Brevibacillus borstelensis]
MDFHYTVTTDKSIEEAINSLEQNLKEHKFGILWQLDLPEKLKDKGVEGFTTPYRVLEVCNPFEAARVLGRNELVGYFLPCKITVYESDGKTKIGLPKPTAMISLLDDTELKEIAIDIEKTLISVIDKSK